MVQWLRVSAIRFALQRPEAQSIAAKRAYAAGTVGRVRLNSSPKLVDKLEHLEGEEDAHRHVFALVDRHAEAASAKRERGGGRRT